MNRPFKSLRKINDTHAERRAFFPANYKKKKKKKMNATDHFCKNEPYNYFDR